MSFKPLGSILSNYAPASPLRKSITAALVVETANQVLLDMFGPEIANFASATYVKHRVLTIACLTTTAAQAIKFRENELFKAIEERLGASEVSRLKFLS